MHMCGILETNKWFGEISEKRNYSNCNGYIL